MLDFRIYTFLTVCETMNFTQASQILHITQPAVSQHIHALEEIYQTKLFTQKGKKLFLTESGELLFNSMNTINHDIKHLQEHIKETSNTLPIKFGATLTVGEYIMPPILTNILKENPKLKVNMLVDNTQNLLKQLNLGKIDFAIVEGFFSTEEYDSLIFKTERFIPVCSSSHNFANNKVCLNDLLKQTLITRELGSGTRDLLEKVFQERNITIKSFSNVYEIGNLNVIKELVKQNLGISFLYESVVKEEIKNNTLTEIDTMDYNVSHEFSFIWQKNSLYSSYYKDIFNTFENNK